MAVPAVTGAGTGTMGNEMVIREIEWTVPKAAKGATVKGAATKGVVGKGVAVNNAATAQSLAQAKIAAMPGTEWELPKAAKAAKAAKTVKVMGAKGTGVALQGGVTNGVTAGKTVVANTGNLPAAGVATAKVSAGSGTIWTGTGMKLGWGLGLGVWGPILLVGTLAAVGVGVYSYMKNRPGGGELEEVTS